VISLFGASQRYIATYIHSYIHSYIDTTNMVRLAMTPAAAAFSKRKPNKSYSSSSVSFQMVLVFVAGFVFGHWHGRSMPEDLASYDAGSAGSSSAASAGRSSMFRLSTTASSPSITASDHPNNKNQDNDNNNNGNNNNNDGWNSIDVFYGSTDHVVSLLPKDQTWFSQARQDEAIFKMLSHGSNSNGNNGNHENGKGGFFVDLAANDATTLSNTYILERDYHWTGLCIEPNPMYWYNLTHYRPNCQIVAAVVGAQRMDQVDFLYEAGDHGGIVGSDYDNGPRWKRKSHVEYTVTLLEILERYYPDTSTTTDTTTTDTTTSDTTTSNNNNKVKVIDYLSLDVEGAEEFIMRNFPLQNYKIRAMTVERPKEGLRKILEAHGYQQLMRLSRWGETLWAHQDYVKDFDMDVLQEFDAKLQRDKEKAAAAAALQGQQQQGKAEGESKM
jgi:hypothetical protein